MSATAQKRVARAPVQKGVARVAVSESNLRKTAIRLLAQSLVSTEVQYIQSVMGSTATQQELDDKVLAVRKMPWSSLLLAE
jgi:hypothetical protein